jgi:hypothetical protein
VLCALYKAGGLVMVNAVKGNPFVSDRKMAIAQVYCHLL